MAAFKTNEFAELILKILFTGEENPPASYFLGLGVGALPDDPTALTLADVVEPTDPSYARQELVRGLIDFPALSEGSSGWSVTSLYKNFGFDGDEAELGYIFLCTVESGTAGILCSVGDIDTFQPSAGDNFDAAYQHTEVTS